MKLFAQIFLKEFYNFITDKNYRQFLKLAIFYGSKPRYKLEEIKFLNYKIHVPDCLSFVWQFKEIFVDKNYLFKAEDEYPVILDCGSNIGTSVLYFKSLYPNSKIICFEADPEIAKILDNNLGLNNINDVELIPKAVWKTSEGIDISPEGADSASIYKPGKKIEIGSVRLKEFINKENKVDFIKMDIEGAEVEVLEDCKDSLENVKNIFIEYHSFVERKQDLDIILTILTKNNFRYFINSAVDKRHPFLQEPNKYNPHMDTQLNIYAYKA